MPLILPAFLNNQSSKRLGCKSVEQMWNIRFVHKSMCKTSCGNISREARRFLPFTRKACFEIPDQRLYRISTSTFITQATVVQENPSESMQSVPFASFARTYRCCYHFVHAAHTSTNQSTKPPTNQSKYQSKWMHLQPQSTGREHIWPMLKANHAKWWSKWALQVWQRPNNQCFTSEQWRCYRPQW